MPASDPGKYDKRMALEQPAPLAATASGEVVDSWAEVAKLWCRLTPLAGREYYQSREVQADTTHNIRTHYRRDITIDSTMRLRFGTRYFQIESIIDVDEAHEEFLIRVIEKHT